MSVFNENRNYNPNIYYGKRYPKPGSDKRKNFKIKKIGHNSTNMSEYMTDVSKKQNYYSIITFLIRVNFSKRGSNISKGNIFAPSDFAFFGLG